MRYVKKILHYFLFYVASTLFVYFLFNAAMSLPTGDTLNLTLDFLGKKVFLPFLYCSFCLVLAILCQIKFLKKEDRTETMIYSCFNIIFFLLVISLGIALFVLGKRKASLPLTITATAFLSFGGLELVYSIYSLITLNKIEDPIMTIEEKETGEK